MAAAAGLDEATRRLTPAVQDWIAREHDAKVSPSIRDLIQRVREQTGVPTTTAAALPTKGPSKDPSRELTYVPDEGPF